jgi:ABC-type multidrug transport system fused ATPase/permease subunit
MARRTQREAPSSVSPGLDEPSGPIPWGELGRLVRGELGLLALGLALMALGSAVGLVFPLVVGLLVDGAGGTPGGASAPAGPARLAGEWLERFGGEALGWTDRLGQVAVALVFLAALSALTLAGRVVVLGAASERVVKRLRERAYRALLRQEVAFFDGRRTGELLSRIASDCTQLQGALTGELLWLVRSAFLSIGGVAFLAWTSKELTLWMLASVPPVAVGGVVAGRYLARLSRKTQDALAEGSAAAEEALGSLRTVRSFAAEERERERFEQRLTDTFKLALERNKVTAAFAGLATFGLYAAVALVLWRGALLVDRDVLTLGELVSFLIYTGIVAAALSSLVDLGAGLVRSAGAARRVFDLLSREPRMPAEGGAVPAEVRGRLTFEGVTFAYPARADVTVLSGLDLTLEPGRTLAVVGASGAGKSTLASLALRFYDPIAGRLALDGRDLCELDPRWLRRQIGLVAQEPVLFSATIAENIRYGRPEASDADVERCARAARVSAFADGLPDKLETQVGERGIQLSGGQKQRVAIARALLEDAAIVILDEATSALDAESEGEVQAALAQLLAERTALVIAHRLSTVRDADEIVVLDAGRVVQRGNHAELSAVEGPYRRLLSRQLDDMG